MGWWEEFNDVPGGNALRYYMGPAYRPVNALAQFGASLLPGADMEDMRQSSADLMDYQGPMETIGDAGWLGLAALGMALPGRPGALQEPVEEATQGIRAYHGSPHDFDRFSMDKIGMGEGAQAYGHGLYFAEKEGVAKSYRDNLTNKAVPFPPGADIRKTAWSVVTNAPDKTDAELAPFVRNAWPNATDGEISDAIAAARAQVKPGKMYEVNIAANPDDFLDWDKPLSEQSEKVRASAESIWRGSPMGQFPDGKPRPFPQEMRGGDFYRARESDWNVDRGSWDNPREAASRELAELEGIPGIRYLDAGSRSAGDGSRNYVVFDENLISILRKYGILAPIAGGIGMNALTDYQGEQY